MGNHRRTKRTPKRLRRLSLIGCGKGARKRKRAGREAAAERTAKERTALRCIIMKRKSTLKILKRR